MRLLRGQRGFTLLEMMLAVTILGAVGGAFLTALANGSRANNILDETVQAEALARSRLEQIKSMPYYPDDSGDSCYDTNDCYPPAFTTTKDFTVTVSISIEKLVTGTTTNALQRVKVSVNRTGSGKPIFSLTTFKVK